MNRNSHRDILLPLVQAVGYLLLWRGIRTRDWRVFAAAGAVLGLAIYTYSPGRFVGILLAAFFGIEWLISLRAKPPRAFEWQGISAAAICAILVMLPLGIYFQQNPVQFIRRFDSASILSASQPLAALSESVIGNLAQYIVPGAGYQSLHYNLPGKPIFDLFLAPWFLAGVAIALFRIKDSTYRFLVLWFIVMMVPPFLTSDMIPKGVRGLGTLPGVLLFVAVAMDALLNYVGSIHHRPRIVGAIHDNPRIVEAIHDSPGIVGAIHDSPRIVGAIHDNPRIVGAIHESPHHESPPRQSPLRHRLAAGLIALTFVASTIWTAYDYFVAWANLPDLPIGFDSDYVETAQYISRLPSNQPAYVSAEVYRHPVFMLLGKQIPTSRYFDRSTRVKEFDAKSTLVTDGPNAVTVFVRDQSPPEDWYRRIAPQNEQIATGQYYAAYRLRALAAPQHPVDASFSPLITFLGYTAFVDEPSGISLYWRIAALPQDRQDMQVKISLLDERGQAMAEKQARFGYPPMEWALGETVVDWFEFDAVRNAPGAPSQFVIELTRGDAVWKSGRLPFLTR